MVQKNSAIKFEGRATSNPHVFRWPCENTDYKKFRQKRYASFSSGKLQNLKAASRRWKACAGAPLELAEPRVNSEKQEWLENIINGTFKII